MGGVWHFLSSSQVFRTRGTRIEQLLLRKHPDRPNPVVEKETPDLKFSGKRLLGVLKFHM